MKLKVLRLSSNMIGNPNDETNFPHKLLTNRQVVNLRKAFAITNHPLILSYQKLNYLR